MGIYVERPQEFDAMQFLGNDANGLSAWLKEGKLTAKIGYEFGTEFAENPTPVLQVRMLLRGTQEYQTYNLPVGSWIVFNVGTRTWDILEDSEFQQNFKRAE